MLKLTFFPNMLLPIDKSSAYLTNFPFGKASRFLLLAHETEENIVKTNTKAQQIQLFLVINNHIYGTKGEVFMRVINHQLKFVPAAFNAIF